MTIPTAKNDTSATSSTPAASTPAASTRGLRLLLLAGAVLAGLGFAAPAAADQLDVLNARIIANPTNVELNLAYARLAEDEGKPRLALAAYERVISLQPGNPEAMAGLRRVRVKIQPNLTQLFTQFGVVWESNALREPFGHNSEFQLAGEFTLKDERAIAGTRWRTLVQGNGYYHFEQDQLNYGFLGVLTGPLITLGPRSRLHIAAGGGAATLDGYYFYSQALGAVQLEVGAFGATQTLRLRAGYRDFGDNFITRNGFFVDLTGKGILPDIENGRTLIVTPWLRYSDFGGTDFNPYPQNTPGKFFEGGVKLEGLQQVTSWLTLGANVSVSDRYFTDTMAPSGSNRNDFYVSPGASVIFPRLIAGNTDLRFDYRFEHNASNDDNRDYDNHRISLTLGSRF